jgi:hypothetical protein
LLMFCTETASSLMLLWEKTLDQIRKLALGVAEKQNTNP